MPDSVAAKQPIDLKRETLTGDVRDHILEFIKQEKDVLPYNQMKESQQRAVVNRAERFAFDLIERVVEIVAADGRDACSFAVKGIAQSTKGNITLKLETPFSRDTWADFGPASTAEVIVTDSKAYQGERRPGGAHVSKDQGSLLNDDGVDEQPVMDQTTAGKKLWIEIGDKTKKLMEFEERSFGDALQRAIKWVGAEPQQVNPLFIVEYLEVDPLEIPEALRRDPETNEPAGLKGKEEPGKPQEGDGGEAPEAPKDDGKKPDID